MRIRANDFWGKAVNAFTLRYRNALPWNSPSLAAQVTFTRRSVSRTLHITSSRMPRN